MKNSENIRTNNDKGRDEVLIDEDLFDLAELFKCFGDSTRIRILYLISENELCVNDIADKLAMNQSAVSHQLKFLKQSKLIGSRRDGKSMLYSLADEHVRSIMEAGLEHVREEA